jgi:bifunctional DNA-binding transcriptional regulator/antitoxin component of YhaV-PrlF toxin-antitoxin module
MPLLKYPLMVKVVNNRGQFKLTIPKDIILAKGWDENTRVIFIIDSKGNVVLREIQKKNAKD